MDLAPAGPLDGAWFWSRRAHREAEEYREAAALCLEYRWIDRAMPAGGWSPVDEERLALLRGFGAPARRIIGLSHTWAWPWPSELWLREHAARYRKHATILRKQAAAQDYRLRRWRQQARSL